VTANDSISDPFFEDPFSKRPAVEPPSRYVARLVLWDVDRRRELANIERPHFTRGENVGGFSPDGRFLLTHDVSVADPKPQARFFLWDLNALLAAKSGGGASEQP